MIRLDFDSDPRHHSRFSHALMKPKPVVFTLAASALLAVSLFLPLESAGQAGSDEAQMQQLLADLTAQQKIIAENQAQIEAKVAAATEEVRVARIFAGRAGGKTK